MKVLSLAWKYHPSITSGVGVACEGLNNALSKVVDLTVIYPKASKTKVEKELILSSDDLDETQKVQIEKEYTTLIEDGNIELAVRLDPYFTSGQSKESRLHNINEKVEALHSTHVKKKTRIKNIAEKIPFDEVDVFGESVKEKIFLYNRMVEELAANLEFDIIHAHDWMTFLAGIFLKDKYNKPLVLHVHSLEYDRVGHKKTSWVYDIERFAMSKADTVISVSDYTVGLIESIYGLSRKRIQKIYNAITIPDFRIENKIKHNQIFKVLFAGRIYENKGIEYFIEIANHVLKKVKDVEFVVVGRGRGNVKFEEIEGFNKIESYFRYLGFVKRNELFQLYNDCDVLCMPSVSEPFGLTAIEAAYVGLPVVLSPNSGASEILKRTPKASFWNTKMFADHILSIKQKSELRKKIISDNLEDISKLSWETSASKVLEIYKGLLNL